MKLKKKKTTAIDSPLQIAINSLNNKLVISYQKDLRLVYLPKMNSKFHTATAWDNIGGISNEAYI